jgi:hypothetical protein
VSLSRLSEEGLRVRTKLTEFEIGSYHENGFLAIQDFLDDKELNHWRGVVEAVAGGPSGEGLSNIRGSDLSDTNPQIAALWRNDTVGALIGQLGRFDAVRHLGDGISYCLQGHGATPWHCTPLDSAEVINLYVSLDEFRWYNKALCFLPGSHKIMPLGVRTVSPRCATPASAHCSRSTRC